MIQDVVIATFDYEVERDLMKRLNLMGGVISTAYLIELRARKVEAGVVKKLLVSLHQAPPPQTLEDGDDVYMYHRQFDFTAFARASYDDRCRVLLETLHEGLLAIAEALGLTVAQFEASYTEVKAANFIYQYKKGKPVANKNAGLAAQLGMVNTPAWASVVAYVQRIEDGHEIETVTFVKKDQPELRFESRYVGKVKWVSSSRLALIPKDPTIASIEADISAVGEE